MSNLLEILKEEFTINDVVNKRYYHTVGVIDMALKLNEVHNLGLDKTKLELSAGFHDIAKLLDENIQLDILKKYYPDEVDNLILYKPIWHSFVGAIYAKEKYQITDSDVLDAIKYHTTGRPNMTTLEKVIFVSDYIEEVTRKMPQMEHARVVALEDLDSGVVNVLKNTIIYLNDKKQNIYYLTEEAYKYYLEGKK